MGNLYQGSVALGASGGGIGSLEELGIIATATELNYVDGVTSNVQTQLNNKIGLYGTGATDGATGLANLFAAGQTVLSSNQYGDTLPSSASEGTMFFKKATGTVADMDTDLLSELMLKAYPVGSVYMSMDATSPAQLFGGTWQQRTDRFLVAAGNAYEAGATGGSSSNTHDHWQTIGWDGNDLYAISSASYTNSRVVQNMMRANISTPNTATAATRQGATYSTTIDTRPPYLAVYMWIRTA